MGGQFPAGLTVNPDNELAIWEKIAAGYARYCSQRQLSIEAKKDVFQLLLLRSMGSIQEVMEQIELRALTVEDAKEILRDF